MSRYDGPGALSRRVVAPFHKGFSQLGVPHRKSARRRYAPGVDESAGETIALDPLLSMYGLRYRVVSSEPALVPDEGPLIVLSVGPADGVRALLLAHYTQRLRREFRILSRADLKHVPVIKDLSIRVGSARGRNPVVRNLPALRAALRVLQAGSAILSFAADPEGDERGEHCPPDPVWMEMIVRMARLTGASILLARVEPAEAAGRRPSLRHRIRVPLTRRMPPPDRPVGDGDARIAITSVVDPGQLDRHEDDCARSRFLAQLCQCPVRESAAVTATPGGLHPAAPVAPAVDPGILATEVESLPAEACLVEGQPLAVYCASASGIPHLIQEIGRLRELTFRATGEGTGQSTDIDLYDDYYQHLFLWNRERREVAGAYRLGLADEIVRRYGKKGLYTHSLFKYRRGLLGQLNPAIELGRSFIRESYQRSYAPLLLLWRGIGQFIVTHPKYRVLFGPVSISNEYHNLSQRLLVDFLKTHNYFPDLGRLVKPRHPYRPSGKRSLMDGDLFQLNLDGLSDVIAQLESDRKGVPILLKQYLKLGGRILGFNVDPAFNNCVDGLIMVDLLKTDPKTLAKYMGRDGAASFLGFHSAVPDNTGTLRVS